MAEFARPITYLDKLKFAERVIRAAQYRADQKQAVRELSEAMTEVVAALLDREQGSAEPPAPADKQPTA